MRDLSGIVKAYDVRGVVGEELDAEVVRDIGAAFAGLVLGPSPRDRVTVLVAHDMRESSPLLAKEFAAGVTSQGVDVLNIGLASTDMLYFASGYLNLPGATFTASHEPARYNGIKLCRAGAARVGEHSGLAEIRACVEQGVLPHSGEPGTISERDMLADYAAYLRRLVDVADCRPLKVVIDAGNGMGGHTVPKVFAGLPFEVVPLYFELDGNFPNHEADPLDPANIADLRAKVVETGADLGLAFDGDADRCCVVDEHGEPVSPSAITALVAVRELAKARANGEAGSTVIHNLAMSHAVPEIVAEHGGKPVRTRVGHSFVNAEMAETGALFGGEHSAHYYFRDFWRADTGMLAALHVLAALGESDGPLSALVAGFTRYASSGEINSAVTDPAGRLAAVQRAYAGLEGATMDELDGLTVELADGSWFNLRPSNNEPLLRLNVEAADAVTVSALADAVLEIVRA